MIVKCYDWLNRSVFVREVDTPILSRQNTDFIRKEVSKHPMYPMESTIVHLSDNQNACYLETLHSHLINEIIKRDLEFLSPKMLHRIFSYFKENKFPDMTEDHFKLCVYDVLSRFNTIVNTRHLIKKDGGLYEKDYKDIEWNEYVAVSTFDAKVNGIEIPVLVDSISYINNRISTEVRDYERLLQNSREFRTMNTFSITDSTVKLTVRGHKVIIYGGDKLRINFYDISEKKYLEVLDFIMVHIIQYVPIGKLNPFVFKGSARDCQEKRQGVVTPKVSDAEDGIDVNYKDIFKCNQAEYSFPGYTKKGALCCFGLEKGVNIGNIKMPDDYTFEPTSKHEYLEKEDTSRKLKKNIYVIDYDTKELIRSDERYDIYDECIVLLYKRIFGDLFILKNPIGEYILRQHVIEKMELTYDYPEYNDIMWLKEFKSLKIRQEYTHEIVDSFGNTNYLEHKSGAYMPVVPQSYTGIWPKKIMSFVDLSIQEDFFKSKNILYEVNEEFIVLKKLGMLLPYNATGLELFNSINQELDSKLLKI